MSFALCELGCPSLNYVYDMTWREFQLRRAGYFRQQLEEWRKVREIAYWSGAGTAFDSSKVKINRFMKLDDDQSKVSESGINALKEAQRKYYERHGG